MGKFRDLTGQTFGRLTVLERAGTTHYKKVTWLCICDCGLKVNVVAGSLLSGYTRSCGCLQRDTFEVNRKPFIKGQISHNRKNYTGETFGRLTVVKRVRTNQHNHSVWLCLCSCGKEVEVTINSLTSGNTSSCGCLKKELCTEAFTTHGLTRSRTYHIYRNMQSRCYNHEDKAFKHYGGRGIKICERWLVSFENFLEDMGECPKGLSIDRIDNNSHYEPVNCRWADNETQANNKRTNVYLLHNGQKLTLTQWSRLVGCSRATIASRMKKGWSPEECLFGRSKKPSSDNPII